MDCKTNIYDSKALPFHACSPFSLSQLFQTDKSKVFETLESNNFSKNMIKHVNGFSKNNYTCGYFDEESAFNLTKKHTPDCLKMIHVNIDSFCSKSLDLSSYLKSLKFKFNIICLSEIRSTTVGIIQEQFSDFDIFIDNPTLAKGGVAILLRKSNFKDVTEIDFDDKFNLKNKLAGSKCIVENKWLSFKIGKQNVILGGIYRHPHRDIDNFNNALKSSLENVSGDDLAIIMGDFNINLLEENDIKVNCYLNNFFACNFIPCITLPTRLTHHSATLIDHIFIKMPKKFLQNKCSSGNLIADIADHLPNFTFLDIKTHSIKNRPYIRLFTPSKIKLFNENMMSEDPLICTDRLTDSNASFLEFSTKYLALFDKYFPYVKISRKAFKDKPHITSAIKVSIKYRNKLFRKYLNNPTDANKAAWKKFRNKTNQIIKKAEGLYYRKMLSEHKNSSKALWNAFGKILNNKKIKHKVGSINSNGIKQSDPQTISETFNKFFSEIGGKLADKFNTSNTEFKKYLGTPIEESLTLTNISEAEILGTIKDLKNTNSTGYDDFSTKFVKLTAPLLAPALVKLFNLALSTGVYPDNLKIAKVIPI